MGPDLTATPRTTACPSCGAAIRPDASWCGQCYADFRPKPAEPELPAEPGPAAGPGPGPQQLPASAPLTMPKTASYGVPVGDPLTAPLLDFLPPVPSTTQPVATAASPSVAEGSRPTWPCGRCSAVNDLADPACAACGSPFLVDAHETKPLMLPMVGDLTRLSRAQRLSLASALVVAVLAPLAVITLLLTKGPPADHTPAPPGSSQVSPEASPPAP